MMLTVVRVYERGRKLSEAELRADTRCRPDLRTQTVHSSASGNARCVSDYARSY